MKFCRNLQRVMDITDPEWAPYWTNYKMLKKFLKVLVPPEAVESMTAMASAEVGDSESPRSASPNLSTSDHSCDDVDDNDSDGVFREGKVCVTMGAPSAACTSSAAQMSRNPGEVAFFRLLNSELKKAINFFDRAQLEFEIREARVREGINIMRKANSLMVSEKWSLMAKSLYRLYKDLLLLETYAIMTYCSFSKILKKHDKVTKHNTRIAFMKNVVNKANFTHYPKLLAMISRCERLYDEVSQSLIIEGKSGLYEDERLFINMIQHLNEEVLEQGALDMEGHKEQWHVSLPPDGASPTPSPPTIPSHSQVNALRSLVEENLMNKSSKDRLAPVRDSKQTVAAMVNNTELRAQTLSKDGHVLGAASGSPGEKERGKRSLASKEGPSLKRAKVEV